MKKTPLLRFSLAVAILALGTVVSHAAEVRIPASTAYLEPNDAGARLSGRSGVSSWREPATKVVWYGQINTTGKLDCSLELRLPAGAESRFRLTVGSAAHEAVAKGSETNLIILPFGSYEIPTTGFQKFTFESLNPPGRLAGDVVALLLDGPSTRDARFHQSRAQRGAPSVHLSYPLPKGMRVEAFYCEVTAVEDPVPTYYMACGWHRGYFGMQVNSAAERRIIFSVWDSGNEGVDRDKVGAADRVTLVAKGEGVYTGDFGNEGTGGHSHLKYPWKTPEKQRFIVTTQPADATHTIFSGYWFHPEKKQWMLISSWKAPKEGGYPHGLYSFSEDFGGTGNLRRKALFGNQWVRDPEGNWHELTIARFSHTGGKERFDRCMGVEKDQFFLAAGGFVNGTTDPGESFARPATGRPPTDINLPPVPKAPEAATAGK